MAARTARSRPWSSRGPAPRRRTVSLPERPTPRPRHPHQHAAQRRLPRLRGAADRVRGRDAAQPPSRSGCDEPAEIRRRNVYTLNDTTPTGQVLRESVAGRRCSSRRQGAATSSASATRPARNRAERRGPARCPQARCGAATGGRRAASGWRSRGTAPASPARGGLPRVRRVGRAHGRWPHPGAHREHRDGPGHEDRVPADGRERARRAGRLGRVRPAGHGRGASIPARPWPAAP
jgi:hypothetical protein